MAEDKHMDRLAQIVLRFLIIQLQKDLMQKKDKEVKAMNTIKLVTTIMAEAEYNDKFKLKKKDIEKITIRKICNNLGIDTEEYELEETIGQTESDIIGEALKELIGHKDITIKEVSIDKNSKDAEELKELLDSLFKQAKGKNK